MKKINLFLMLVYAWVWNDGRARLLQAGSTTIHTTWAPCEDYKHLATLVRFWTMVIVARGPSVECSYRHRALCASGSW